MPPPEKSPLLAPLKSREHSRSAHGIVSGNAFATAFVGGSVATGAVASGVAVVGGNGFKGAGSVTKFERAGSSATPAGGAATDGNVTGVQGPEP